MLAEHLVDIADGTIGRVNHRQVLLVSLVVTLVVFVGVLAGSAVDVDLGSGRFAVRGREQRAGARYAARHNPHPSRIAVQGRLLPEEHGMARAVGNVLDANAAIAKQRPVGDARQTRRRVLPHFGSPGVGHVVAAGTRWARVLPSASLTVYVFESSLTLGHK